MKTIAILQSNYMPWKGYFDIIHDVDEFIFYDEVQYTNRDWRSRNKIQQKNGTIWISIPVGSHRDKKISEIQLMDPSWQKKHYSMIYHAYHKAPFFRQYQSFLEHIYLENAWTNLSDFNNYVIKYICKEILGIQTCFSDSTQYQSQGNKHDKLLSIVIASNANKYISGPSAKDYIDEEEYLRYGIELVWKNYNGYPEYMQTYSPFTHFVSIIDLLVNVGNDAPWFIWGWRNSSL